jgi:hypothetical protein
MALPSRPSIWQLVRMKLISCFVNKQQFVRRAVLTCSKASSLVLFTTILELPLTMTLAAVVLPVTDRQLLAGRKKGSPSTYLAPSSCDRNRPPQSQVTCKLTHLPHPSPTPPLPSKFPEPQLPSALLRRPREYSCSCYPEHSGLG